MMKTPKSRDDAADVVANVLSRSLTLDDEDVEIDIDVSESRIDDVGIVMNSQKEFDLRIVVKSSAGRKNAK